MINEEIILNKVEEVLNDKLTVLEFNISLYLFN